MLRFRSCIALVLLAAMTACGTGDSPDAVETAGPDFDVAELADDVRAQDDFWQYVNGKWLAETEIPGDRSSYSSAHIIVDATEARTRALLEQATALEDADEVGQKVGDLFGSFMATEQIEARGVQPLTPYVQQIDAIADHEDLIATFGALAGLGMIVPINFFADGDAFDATRSLIYLYQSGLGLPDRSYYLSDNAKLIASRHAYQGHISDMFAVVGWDQGDVHAASIVALETRLAELHWTRLQNRDRQKIYANQLSFAQAQAAVPGIDLAVWFRGYGAPQPEKLVVAQDTYFANLGEVIHATPLATWRAYLKFHLLKLLAPYLTEEIVTLNFEFQGKELRGQTEQAERWRRGVRFVNLTAGELLGQLYVRAHFSQQAKQEVAMLVENLREAFAESIQALPWMGAATKQQALVKLEKFLPKLGYPDEWRDFSDLKTAPDDLAGNFIRAREFARDYNLKILAEPVDRSRWTTYPHMVNAFYRPTHNAITFPAGILQLPMFASGRDPAMNYGAIGSIIGHEFSHGFDDQGRKFDGDGLLRNWWTEEDAAEYRRRAEVQEKQFAAFQPLPDTAIDGKLTLGENIGDLAGLLMAYKAFELSGHADGPELGGFTPRQRFFISYAIAWRTKIRPQYLRELLLRDTHSPAEYRVMGILPNVPGFYRAFDVNADDGMYLAPEQRAKIW